MLGQTTGSAQTACDGQTTCCLIMHLVLLLGFQLLSDCGVFIHVDELLEGFMGDQGLDTLGVPLFDNEKM